MKHLFDSLSAYSLVQTQLLYMKYVKSRCQCWHESCWNNQILKIFFKQDTNRSDGNIISGPISLPHLALFYTEGDHREHCRHLPMSHLQVIQQPTWPMCQEFRPQEDSGVQLKETHSLNLLLPVLWWNHLVSLKLPTGTYKKLHMFLTIKVDMLSSKLLILCLKNTYNEAHLCTRIKKHHTRSEQHSI